MGNSQGDLVSLGETEIMIPHLGVGAWSWGDRFYWNTGAGRSESDFQAAFETSLVNGVNVFDTAEIYGFGASERLLGKYLHQTDRPVIVATKFMPFPWRLRKKDLRDALRKSLDRMELEQVDLYQIHWPMPLVAIETWMDAMAEAIEAGTIKAVGVSNYDVTQTKQARDILSRHGIPLASNQVHYNLINRQIEEDGLLDYCREAGVTVIAYSPIFQGYLSGKYTAENPPRGIRALRFGRSLIRAVEPLIDLLRSIGAAHDGKTPAQVALNWTICKGTVPIPGARNAQQARENAGALGWRLTGEEIKALDKTSASLPIRTSWPR